MVSRTRQCLELYIICKSTNTLSIEDHDNVKCKIQCQQLVMSVLMYCHPIDLIGPG